MDLELLPCPFCGGSPGITEWAVVCTVCNATGPEAETEEEAIIAWNTRHEERVGYLAPDEPGGYQV